MLEPLPVLLLLLFVASAPQTLSPPSEGAAEEASPATDRGGEEHRDGQEKASEQPRIYDEIEVRSRAEDLVGIARSATEGVTGAEDLATRPLLRTAEVIETVPGIIATQHSGGGKANQYFLRGFNLDHGTDLSVSVAGMPVNMPTHGHGQGYADLNFLIPELIERVHYDKGPYRAENGDFSASGAIEVDLLRSLSEPLVKVSGGSYDSGRVLLAGSHPARGGELTGAVEVFHIGGPWTRSDDFEGLKGFAKYNKEGSNRGFSFTVMAYEGDWLSTDQIPLRAVESGQINRFDLIDPGPRGKTDRYSLSAQAYRGTSNSLTRLTGYLISYDFRLFSNFTYFLGDPENGDQFEQIDKRNIGGVEVRYTRMISFRNHDLETTTGIQTRVDDVANGLFPTLQLERIGSIRSDGILQWSAAPFLTVATSWSPRFRTEMGLRLDHFSARVDSDLDVNSGTQTAWLASPKLSLVFTPLKTMEIYTNFGLGFHSNDARGMTIRIDPASQAKVDPVTPLARATGAEVGFRSSPLPQLRTSLAVFLLDFDSELVFVGDAGTTEAGRPSRRAGIEWSSHYQFGDRLAVDLDATLARARFLDEDPAGRKIPGSVARTLAAGLTFTGSDRLSGSLRLRYFGGIPLTENGSKRGSSSTLVNFGCQWTLSEGLALALEGFNILNREQNDIEYYYASRLPGETEGVEDIHFHPVPARSARLTLIWQPSQPSAP